MAIQLSSEPSGERRLTVANVKYALDQHNQHRMKGAAAVGVPVGAIATLGVYASPEATEINLNAANDSFSWLTGRMAMPCSISLRSGT